MSLPASHGHSRALIATLIFGAEFLFSTLAGVAAGADRLPTKTVKLPFDMQEATRMFCLAGRRHHGDYLRAMEEPQHLDGNGETYRLLWLRTFHTPMVFRLDVARDGTSKLTTKATTGRGGYEPGILSSQKSTFLSTDDTTKLRQDLERAGFWNMAICGSSFGNDGASWVLEGIKDGKHHQVDRWSPSNGPFYNWALRLMRASEVYLDPIY